MLTFFLLEGLALLNRPDILESRLLRISCVDNPKLPERMNKYLDFYQFQIFIYLLIDLHYTYI